MRTDGRPLASAVASATTVVSTPRASARSIAVVNSVMGFVSGDSALKVPSVCDYTSPDEPYAGQRYNGPR